MQEAKKTKGEGVMSKAIKSRAVLLAGAGVLALSLGAGSASAADEGGKVTR